jgi:hypothetical protein
MYYRVPEAQKLCSAENQAPGSLMGQLLKECEIVFTRCMFHPSVNETVGLWPAD